MTAQGKSQELNALELLINEAQSLNNDCQYLNALAAAERAVSLAEELNDPAWLVRALLPEEEALRLSGQVAAALIRSSRILAMAEDPDTREALTSDANVEDIFLAYIRWIDAAHYVTDFPCTRLFDVVDAADRWLRAVGHPEWRSALVLARSNIYRHLGKYDLALSFAEEALATYKSSAPGFSIGSYRRDVARCKLKAGHYRDAEAAFKSLLDSERDTSLKSQAFAGLAQCALRIGDEKAASRYAASALRLADQVGDYEVCIALECQVEIFRAMGDLPAAWKSSTRQLEAAKRCDVNWRLYCATRDLIDVALDRRDLDSARAAMPALEKYAANEDKAVGRAKYMTESAERRRRLVESAGAVDNEQAP